MKKITLIMITVYLTTSINIQAMMRSTNPIRHLASNARNSWNRLSTQKKLALTGTAVLVGGTATYQMNKTRRRTNDTAAIKTRTQQLINFSVVDITLRDGIDRSRLRDRAKEDYDNWVAELNEKGQSPTVERSEFIKIMAKETVESSRELLKKRIGQKQKTHGYEDLVALTAEGVQLKEQYRGRIFPERTWAATSPTFTPTDPLVAFLSSTPAADSATKNSDLDITLERELREQASHVSGSEINSPLCQLAALDAFKQLHQRGAKKTAQRDNKHIAQAKMHLTQVTVDKNGNLVIPHQDFHRFLKYMLKTYKPKNTQQIKEVTDEALIAWQVIETVERNERAFLNRKKDAATSSVNKEKQ